MSELPQGWEMKTLSDVATWGSGGTPKAGQADYYDGPIAWAVIGDLNDGMIGSTAKTITRKALDESSAKVVNPGAVLVAMYGSIGKLGMPMVPMATNQAIAFAVPHEGEALQKYLFWYLRSQRDQLASAGKGATQSNISQTVLKVWPIPIPPLPEQQRIVDVIEEQFSRLDAGVESLQRAKRNLTRLRASILKAAVEGQLALEGTAAERLASSDGPYPIPAGWKWERLEVVAEVSGGIQKQPKRRPRDNAYSYLRVANVGRDLVDLTDVHEMQLFDGELERYRLEAGDLLVVEGNGSQSQIGRSAVWRGEIENCVHQNHIIRVRPGRRLVPRFLNLYWNSPHAIRRITEVAASTSGLYTLSTSKVKAVPVPVPPIATQHAVVAEAERQSTILDSMAETIDSGLRRTHGLRQAILRDAFSGHLVRA